MSRSFLLSAILLLTASAQAQLIPPGTAVPISSKPPVVFVDGYQTSCTNNQFADNFGKFDQLFQATGRVSVFFDNCAFPTKPPIEDLGNDFKAFLAGLKYTDGSPVTQVDVVCHSMGGLIVRSYLAGKQSSGGYNPPANPGIRKIVFLATPHFGSPVSGLFGPAGDPQATALANGSLFDFDLATWNDRTDDLRGIDALSLAGNGGTGRLVASGFDDGVVSLSSASIGFARPGRTRVIPYCHTPPGLVTLAGFCGPTAPGIADGENATDANVAATLSFLNDTPDWQAIGQAAEQNPLLSINGGLIGRAKSADDQYLALQSASSTQKDLNIQGNAVAWTESLSSAPQTITLKTPSGTITSSLTPPAGYVTATVFKTGPYIARVLPSAAALSPLGVASGMFVAIYGSNLASAAQQATSLPLPTSLGGVQVKVNDTPAGLQFAGPTQVNAIIPSVPAGLVQVTVVTGGGSHSVNVLVAPAIPALYTQDQSGAGPAAALNAVTNALVTSAAPLHPGDYVALYLTGLGAIHTSGGLSIADNVPTVSVGGKPCQVNYAGRAPGFDGLDQIDCRIAPDAALSLTSPVSVTSAGRTSNIATLAIQ